MLSQLPCVADCVPALFELEYWSGVVDGSLPLFEMRPGFETAAAGLDAAAGLEAAAATTGGTGAESVEGRVPIG